MREHPRKRPILPADRIRKQLATAHRKQYPERMATTYTIRPSYGAELYIGEEGDIVIHQDTGRDAATIVLTPAEAEAAMKHIQQLLIELRGRDTK